MMNRTFEHIGREMPYDLPEGSFDALRERIRSRTTGVTAAGARRPLATARPGARKLPLWIAAGTAAAAVVVAGVFFATRIERPADPSARLEKMLSTAAPETVQRAAAENYDDIFYNQQL